MSDEPERTDEPPPALEPGEEWLAVEPPAPEDFAEPPPPELWRRVGDARPWGTMLVLLAWVGVFAWQAAHGELDVTSIEIARGANLARGDWHDLAPRLLASTFLHASPSHVFFNALTLLVLGQAVEWVFARAAFALVFVLGGGAASLATVMWHAARPDASAYVGLGGSGAVFALGGALLPGAWRLRRHLAVGRARALAAVVLILTLPAMAAGAQAHGTDNVAHAGGFAAGLALGLIVPLSPRLSGRPAGVVANALGLLAAAMLAAALLRVVRG